MSRMDDMFDKIDWWAGWVKDEEVFDIRDIGRLVYRLEQHVRISDAEELLDWLTRMNKCIENEFTEPGPIKEYKNRLFGKQGRLYFQGGPPEGIPIESEIRWEYDEY